MYFRNVVVDALIDVQHVFMFVMSSMSALGIESFLRAKGTRGPHSIGKTRQVRNRFHRIYSVKAGNRVVIAESRLEADAIFWAESQPSIVSLCEQPMRINGSLNKRPYYTFDLGVVYRSGEEVFYEVKPCEHLVDNEEEPEPEYWNVIKQWCSANGYTCAVKTDSDLKEAEVLIKNWRLLLGYVRTGKELGISEMEEKLLSIIDIHGLMSTLDITNYVSQEQREFVLPAISCLLHSGSLDASLSKNMFNVHSPLAIPS
jgi:hypothetical protein